jgi:hypothetical protein
MLNIDARLEVGERCTLLGIDLRMILPTDDTYDQARRYWQSSGFRWCIE